MDLKGVPLISADSHVEEPSYLWSENLPAQLVERLPPELRPESDSGSTFAQRIGLADAFAEQGLSEAAKLAGAHDFDALCELTADPELRFSVMSLDGIAGECIYPTSGLYVWNTEDPELGEACCRLYNDWIHDRLESRSPRFRCAGMIPTWNVDRAIAEVQRNAGLGLASAMLPLSSRTKHRIHT